MSRNVAHRSVCSDEVREKVDGIFHYIQKQLTKRVAVIKEQLRETFCFYVVPVHGRARSIVYDVQKSHHWKSMFESLLLVYAA